MEALERGTAVPATPPRSVKVTRSAGPGGPDNPRTRPQGSPGCPCPGVRKGHLRPYADRGASRGSMSPSPTRCWPAADGHSQSGGRGVGAGALPRPRPGTEGVRGAREAGPRRGGGVFESPAGGSGSGHQARPPARGAGARPRGEPALEWRREPRSPQGHAGASRGDGGLTGGRAGGRGWVPEASGAGSGGGGGGYGATAESGAEHDGDGGAQCEAEAKPGVNSRAAPELAGAGLTHGRTSGGASGPAHCGARA